MRGVIGGETQHLPLTVPATIAMLLVGGCETDGNDTSSMGETGTARIAITNAPEDVSCIVIAADGVYRNRTEMFDVDPGDSTVFLDLTGLPVGRVIFDADAFDEACADVDGSTSPTWIAEEPVAATIMPAQISDVFITMIRNGRADVSVDFPDEPLCLPDGDACSDDLECCSGSCASGVCEPTLGCNTLTVTGFDVQPALNTTFMRYDTLAWESQDHTITYSAEDGLWEIWKKPEATGAGRPALCEASEPGDGPWDCADWREWRGSSLGFVSVPASFVCSVL